MDIKQVKKEDKEGLILIPYFESYLEYMIEIIMKLPRTEKFSIGTIYKESMYEAYRNIMYLSKVEEKNRLYYLNKIDADLNVQRVLLRIMNKYKWISNEKYKYVMIEKIGNIGKVLGGLIKYYAKNDKR